MRGTQQRFVVTYTHFSRRGFYFSVTFPPSWFFNLPKQAPAAHLRRFISDNGVRDKKENRGKLRSQHSHEDVSWKMAPRKMGNFVIFWCCHRASSAKEWRTYTTRRTQVLSNIVTDTFHHVHLDKKELSHRMPRDQSVDIIEGYSIGHYASPSTSIIHSSH